MMNLTGIQTSGVAGTLSLVSGHRFQIRRLFHTTPLLVMLLFNFFN